MALEYIIPTPIEGYEVVGVESVKVCIDASFTALSPNPVARVAVHAKLNPDPDVKPNIKIQMAHFVITEFKMIQESYPLFSIAEPNSSINVLGGREVNVSSKVYTSVSDFNIDNPDISALNGEDVLEVVLKILATLTGE